MIKIFNKKHKTVKNYLDLSSAEKKKVVEEAAKEGSKKKKELIEKYNKLFA